MNAANAVCVGKSGNLGENCWYCHCGHLAHSLLLNYLQKQAGGSRKSWWYAVCLVEHKLNMGLKTSYLPTGSVLSMCVLHSRIRYSSLIFSFFEITAWIHPLLWCQNKVVVCNTLLFCKSDINKRWAKWRWALASNLVWTMKAEVLTVSMWNGFRNDCSLAVSLHSNQEISTEKDRLYTDNVMSCKEVRFLLLRWPVWFFFFCFVSQPSQLCNSAFKEFEYSIDWNVVA